MLDNVENQAIQTAELVMFINENILSFSKFLKAIL